MNLENFITSQIGLIHFIASVFALILGSIVLFLKKGTQQHRRIGILYSLCMVVVLTTAFLTYQLYGSWGIFHWTALVSSITLFAGLFPIYYRPKINNSIILHFSFMYWSVIGLYSAFVSETLVRFPNVVVESGIPNHVFYTLTGIGSALVMGLGAFFFIKFKPKWEKEFCEK